MNTIAASALLLSGSALLGLAVANRAGRTPAQRAWADGPDHSVGTALMMVPGGGFGLLAAGASHWAGRSVLADIVLVAGLIAFVVLVLYAGLRLPVPLWFVPAWSRDRVAAGRAARAGARDRRRGRTRR